MLKKILLSAALLGAMGGGVSTSAKSLHELQQEFVDLKFGLFVHFGMGTYLEEDWANPDVPPQVFNPQKLDCRQWIEAARSANMKFGCMAVKHHNGFCMWDTKTTDYNVMNSGIKRDVVKEFTDALHEQGMPVMFHFSMLDLHEKVLPRHIMPYHKEFLKAQLRELLTGYGPITALMIDGWDAPWARISYEDLPFQEIYDFIKSIQPDCLVMDLNGAKYPGEALFYSDIKTYEQGAGQKIEKEKSFLPSMACYPIQDTWFWKERFPGQPTKSPKAMVNDNLVPMNNVCCTYILNVAPNRDGLFDKNACEALKQIGKMWKDDGVRHEVAECEAPIVASNLAKGKYTRGSWSYDMQIHDLATDDDFSSPWVAKELPGMNPWLAVELGEEHRVNAVVITDYEDNGIEEYRIDCRHNGVWTNVFSGGAPTKRRVKIHRFPTVVADAVLLAIVKANGEIAISELGVYNESR